MLICLHGRASGLDFGKNSIYFREEHKGQANNRPADGGASRRDRGQSNSRSVRLLACGLCRAALPEALAVEARAETEARTEEAIEIGHVVEAAVIAHLGHFHRGLREQPAGYPEAVFIEGGDKCLPASRNAKEAYYIIALAANGSTEASDRIQMPPCFMPDEENDEAERLPDRVNTIPGFR